MTGHSTDKVPWKNIEPDDNNDWLNLRNPLYRKYPQISGEELSPFYKNTIGINTNRDSWLYGYGKNKVEENVSSMINYYSMNMGKNVDYESIANNSQYIKWSAKLKNLYNNHQGV